MWFTAASAWLKGNFKWVMAGLAVGTVLFTLHSLKNAGREIGQLRAGLSAEREVRSAIEADYRALVDALEQEKRAAESIAAATDHLTREIANVSDQDRPVGPVLRRTLDGLRDAAAADGR